MFSFLFFRSAWLKAYSSRIQYLRTIIVFQNRESTTSLARHMYLETLRQMVLGLNLGRYEVSVKPRTNVSAAKYMGRGFQSVEREEGIDWPGFAYTMTGSKRIHSVQRLLESIFHAKVEGDVIETGVWRGGMSIFMRGVIHAYGQQHRKSYVCDSFRGLPPSTLGEDKSISWDNTPYLEVSDEDVKSNFEAMGLSDHNVVFVKGFFSDTMGPLREQRGPEGKFSLMRLDGDMYESTVVGSHCRCNCFRVYYSV